MEVVLVAAEEAKAALARASLDTSDGWEARFTDAEARWIEAEQELRQALAKVGMDVDRVVEVLR